MNLILNAAEVLILGILLKVLVICSLLYFYHCKSVQFFITLLYDLLIKIKDLVANFAKENGATEISAFKLYILGEGIEKKENDFAAEVASMTR